MSEHHQCWITGFIDLLGQKELFKKIDRYPNAEDQKPGSEIMRSIRKAYGGMKFLTDQITDILEAGTNRVPPASVNEEKLEIWKRMAPPETHLVRFSDGYLACFSMDDYEQHSIPSGVYNMLVLAGQVMFLTLASEIPVRMGIATGWGMMYDGLLYGPPVANAYELENCVAEFPRAVVQAKLVTDYLTPMSCNSVSGPNEAFNRHISTLCLELIKQDEDGNWFVDYLSPVYKSLFQSTEHGMQSWEQLARLAHAFVVREAERLEGDPKLGPRYSRLKAYFDANSSLFPS